MTLKVYFFNGTLVLSDNVRIHIFGNSDMKQRNNNQETIRHKEHQQ